MMKVGLSLSNIISEVLKKDSTFFELEKEEQREVLDYISNNNLSVKVFRKKWYDILSNKFYVEEFVPLYSDSVSTEKFIFGTFEEFYNYVKGDIYGNRSCFFGYDFSDEEIEKYSLELSKLNFVCFCWERFDDYDFSLIMAKKEQVNRENLSRTKLMLEWIDNCKTITTIEELESKADEFVSKFGPGIPVRIFFSMILRRDKEYLRIPAIQYAITHDEYEGISFISILLNYGRDDALMVIDNFSGVYSSTSRYRLVYCYKNALTLFDKNALNHSRRLGYSPNLCLYYVYDRYFGDGSYALSYRNYFGTFNEFVLFVNGDLSGADLRNAPVSKNRIFKYKTDSKTKLPFSKVCKGRRIYKYFEKNNFIVKQEWLDKDGIVIYEVSDTFDKFFDFAYFLYGDLSNADLLFCEGLENIKNLDYLKLVNLKIRSEISDILDVPYLRLPTKNFITANLEQVSKYQMEPVNNPLGPHPEDEYKAGRVSYISDIHLMNRFKDFNCKSQHDVDYVSKTIANTIYKESKGLVLIGGDTSSDFNIFRNFVNDLADYSFNTDYFFTLGNHELWAFKDSKLPSIIDTYRVFFSEKREKGFYLVQNNIFYFDDKWCEITERELAEISLDDLRKKTRAARVVIFGGIGFAGTNDFVNANSEIYMNVLNRQEEIEESEKFFNLYKKVISALKDKNLIIFTHMPMYDWGGRNIQPEKEVVYISGHNHKNEFYDDGIKRIYADNQIGYHKKDISLKTFSSGFIYDWFIDYKDGIYEISRSDYEQFYLGLGKRIFFNSKFEKLYLLKREKTYMFLIRGVNGSLYVLEGGRKRSVVDHPMTYFFDSIKTYSEAIMSFLSGYFKFQKQISREIKKIGGDGRIHGCIIDINFFNHLYLNPLDGKIKAYYGNSMVNKYVYSNLASLLKYECPQLYKNYEHLLKEKKDGVSLILYNDENLSDEKVYVDTTEIYEISRIIQSLHPTGRNHVICLWNDAFAKDTSIEVGKFIVSGLINPELLPRTVFKKETKKNR